MLFYEKLKDESPDFMNGLKKVLGWLINFKKSKTLSSTTYVLTASFLAILFFDKEIAITSISIMILSDSVASIVGRSFGKRIVYDKTMEGSAAFLVTSIVISMFLFFSMYDTQKFIISSLAGSIVATIAELIASKIDVNDNILVTLSTAVTMQFMFVIL
jgi:dolichol kinase